jgi:excisionase family DNA binding protein
MTIAEAAEKLGIGRNQGYEAARTGQIPTIKIGKRLLVPVTALENKLANAGSSNRDKVA